MASIKFSKSVFNLRWNQILTNPFFIYAFSFIGALLLYELKWINYPRLSIEVYLFIISTVVISIILGLYVKIPDEISVVPGINQNYLFKIILVFFIISSIGFIITFIDSGTLLGKILFTEEHINYQLDYPTIRYLTRFVKVLNAVVLLFSLHFYYSFKDRRFLWISLICIIPILLLFNRFYATNIILPVVFIFLIHTRLSIFKLLSVGILSFILFSLTFAIVGNYREEAKKRNNNQHLFDKLEIRNYPGFLSKEFIWVYFYISSPIGKLQYVIDDPEINENHDDYVGLFVHALTPRSLGARLNGIFKSEPRKSYYKYPSYYVGTTYRDAYYYAHWKGIFIMMFLLFSSIFLVVRFLLRNQTIWYFIPLISLFNTQMLLSPFGNTFVMTTTMSMIFLAILISLLFILLSKKNTI